MSTADESLDQDLFNYVRLSVQEEEDLHFLRFEFLQRLNLTQLEVELARLRSKFNRNKALSLEDKTNLRIKLNEYAQAIWAYDLINKKKPVAEDEMQVRKIRMQSHLLAKDDYGDVFHSHYAFFVDKEQRTDPLREFVMESFPRWLTYSRKEKLARKKEYGEGKRPNEVSPLVDKFVRFSVAITGGLFLVVPMLIMTLGGQSQNKSLITVSVAVFWFVLSLAFGIRVSNAETLVATATYAAVLVVFVGTSSSGSNS